MDRIIPKMKNSSVLKKIIASLLLIVMSGAIGQLLLMAAYRLPTSRIASNISVGGDILLLQGAEYNYAEDYTESILDNETDAVILSEALFPEESPINGAVMVPRYVFHEGETQVLSLKAFLNKDDISGAHIVNYPRYWHGYLAVLKPLFCVFDYSDFKIINQAVQLILICVLFFLFIKRNLEKYIFAFIPMLIIWNPATIGVSLQYAACFYVSIIGSIIVLHKDWQDPWMFFVGLGIIISYLDFLTYPLVTLGIPLIFWVIKNVGKLKIQVSSVLKYGLYWSTGYVGMWGVKWILGTLISRENILFDALFNIESRTSTMVDGETITRIGTVIRLIDSTFFKWPYLIMFLCVTIYLFAKYYKTLRINSVTIALFCIAIMPIVWFIFTANHSYIHPRLVYRNWGITIFAFLSIPLVGSGIETKTSEKVE
ncbi:hypothetical protein [Butyrivibrio sp. INlla21]|uniref:hypothetical protein n=1 Tax=Butyrivibrio sp. INlla21 TaxID=1520811 RepID=UPI000B80C33E|nr:hypothetical protein [Butyrivibrio sp. INlla21]